MSLKQVPTEKTYADVMHAIGKARTQYLTLLHTFVRKKYPHLRLTAVQAELINNLRDETLRFTDLERYGICIVKNPVRNVKQLKERGLLQAVPSHDKREHCVRLTPFGKEVCASIDAWHEQMGSLTLIAELNTLAQKTDPHAHTLVGTLSVLDDLMAQLVKRAQEDNGGEGREETAASSWR